MLKIISLVCKHVHPHRLVEDAGNITASISLHQFITTLILLHNKHERHCVFHTKGVWSLI